MARGWKIANGSKIIANFNCTVNDIWNMFILDGGKTHYADLPRQEHIKKETYPQCNTQWGQIYFPLFLTWLLITIFLLRPTFLKKTLFTFRLIQDQPSSRLSSYVTTSSCLVVSQPLLPKPSQWSAYRGVLGLTQGGWLKSHERTITYTFRKKGWAAVTLLVWALLQPLSLNYT